MTGTHDLIKTHSALCSSIQNIFHPSKYGKGVSRSASDFIVFPQNDRYGMKNFSRTILPDSKNLFNEAFESLLKKFPNDRPYLVIDTNPLTKMKGEEFRVRSRIFPDPITNKVQPIFFTPS